MSRGRGRGRGRGKGRGLGGLEPLGIVLGAPLPPPILQPPPLFPPLDRKPLELGSTVVDRYLLSVKQEFRQYTKQSPFYLKAGSDKKDILRYSDKYEEIKRSEIDNFLDWTPDWSFFPDELQIRVRSRKRLAGDAKFKPTIPTKKRRKEPRRAGKELTLDPETAVSELLKEETSQRTRTKKDSLSEEDETLLSKRFEQLEKSEEAETEREEEEVAEEDEIYDEEVEEEGTDYNLTYFDPGEEYAADDDDGLEEGPYYS